ncbi:MAG: hypothetical protein P8Z42_08865, partial [Anaerolineales bacterium]
QAGAGFSARGEKRIDRDLLWGIEAPNASTCCPINRRIESTHFLHDRGQRKYANISPIPDKIVPWRVEIDTDPMHQQGSSPQYGVNSPKGR